MSAINMARNVRLTPVAAVEPSEDAFAPFRERIASRCEEHAAMYPRAVDLEARVLAVLHSALRGCVTALRGLHSARRFTEAVLGSKHFRVADLCRLATEPTREARAAVMVVVQELAASLGYRLEPLEGRTVDAHEAMAGVVETNAALTAELSRDLADGRLSAEEARDLRPEIDAHKARIAQLETVVAEAEARG